MTTKQAVPSWRKEADGHYRLTQKPPMPECLDPEVWTPQRVAEIIEKWRRQEQRVPPNHLHPLTNFQVGDWVRVCLVPGNKNTNGDMHQANGQWFKVKKIVDDMDESPGMRLRLEGIDWNWFWYHLDAHTPIRPKAKQQPPLLPDI